MPIYEYRCAACGHRFERLQKMSDPDPEQCPACEAATVIRLISPVGFRLKGGGWYETDFKQSHRRNVAGGEGASEKKEKSAADGAKDKGTDKPAGKKEPASDGAGKKTAGKTGEAA